MKRCKYFASLKMAATKPAPTPAPEVVDAVEIMREGMRSYIVRDYNLAVQMLGKAIEMIAGEKGEKTDSLGEAYLKYGKSLLELSRDEADPFGDAVPRELKRGGAESDDTSDGSVDPEEEDVNAAETADTGKEQDTPEEAKTNGKSAEDTNGVKEDAKEKKPEAEVEPPKAADAEDAKAKDDAPGTSGARNEDEKGEDVTAEEAEDENPTDLQLAWEVLELAKLIFEARGERSEDLLADTLVTLGEVAMESENFESAINDIKAGLEIQKKVYDRYSRIISETHYKLGIALAANNQLQEAVESFVDSHAILVDRVSNLEENNTEHQDELKELRVVIPEIYEKIIDTRNLKNELAKQKKEEDEKQKESPSSQESKPNDISHLVKRKRKLEDIVEETSAAAAAAANPAKKPSP